MNIEKIKTKKAEVTLLAPQIIRINLTEHSRIYKHDVLEIHAACLALAEKSHYSIIHFSKESIYLSPEARELCAGLKLSKYRIANALVANSKIERLISRYFIESFQPVTPTRLFDSEQKALDWLTSFSKN